MSYNHPIDHFNGAMSETLADVVGKCTGPFNHDDVIKWKHFPRYSLIWAWMNGWVNNREAGDLRRNRVHYDVIVM